MLVSIKRYEGLYAADDRGDIWSTRSGSRLKPYLNTGGYLRVNLHNWDGKVRHEYVHRLVAEAFIPNPNNLPEVNHKNADRSDNRAVNLEWTDRYGNVNHALGMGRWSKKVRVRAINVETGEMREYPFLKYAAKDLFGKPYALQFCRKRYGSGFLVGDWVIEVQDEICTA